jgi:hypothetical protein
MSETQFEPLYDNFPDWQDSGRRVVVKSKDGKVATGILRADDFFFDGENEIPIFHVKSDDGQENLSLPDFDEIKYLPDEASRNSF